MTQREIRDALAGAAEYLSAHPAEARYTDSPATARLADPDGLRVTVSGPNGTALSTDMPISVGGTDSAASPGWHLRAAEASCVATLVAMRAAHEGVRLLGLEVTVDSESDDRGILGLSDDVPAGPLRTTVHVTIHSQPVDDEDDGVWDTIVAWAVEHCPVTDAVRRAIPMSVQVTVQE